MTQQSALSLARHIQAEIAKALAGETEPDAPARALFAKLKRNAADMRLDVRDYELAETRSEQEQLGRTARERLAATEQGMLLASQHNVFGAVEVAHLSAQIAQLSDRLV